MWGQGCFPKVGLQERMSSKVCSRRKEDRVFASVSCSAYLSGFLSFFFFLSSVIVTNYRNRAVLQTRGSCGRFGGLTSDFCVSIRTQAHWTHVHYQERATWTGRRPRSKQMCSSWSVRGSPTWTQQHNHYNKQWVIFQRIIWVTHSWERWGLLLGYHQSKYKGVVWHYGKVLGNWGARGGVTDDLLFYIQKQRLSTKWEL